MKKYFSSSLVETQTIANEILEKMSGGEVLGLIGDLGAGKTTFVQFLAQALGVKEKVNSPTFALMKVYQTTNAKIKTLVHADAYRLNQADELKNVGLAEYFNQPDCVVVIEWADKVKNILPSNAVLIDFKEAVEVNQRIIEIN